MNNASSHKAKKAKQRERRVHRERMETRARAAYRSTFPETVVNPGDAEPGYVAMVRDAVQRLRFDDDILFAPAMIEAAELIRQQGFGWLSEGMTAAQQRNPRENALFLMLMSVGNVLYALMPQGDLEEWALTNSLQVLPYRNQFAVRCYGLQRVKHPGGTIYHSPFRPTAIIGGGPKIIGYTTHALHQLYDRIVPAWRTYLGQADAFAFARNLVHYEPAHLPDGQDAFVVWEKCHEHCWYGHMAEAILGPVQAATGRWMFRVGYAPVILHQGFAAAKTLLPPGYRGTPEFELLQRAVIPREMRARLRQSASNLTTKYLQTTGDFSALKFFHEAGIAQVVPLKDDIYKTYSDRPERTGLITQNTRSQ